MREEAYLIAKIFFEHKTMDKSPELSNSKCDMVCLWSLPAFWNDIKSKQTNL